MGTLIGKAAHMAEAAYRFYTAIMEGDLQLVKELVQTGVALEVTSGEQGTPLHWAIEYGKTTIVKFLIQSGANLNDQRTQFRQTPLIHAAYKGRLKHVEMMLAAGADINITDANGWTPLDKAAWCEYTAAGQIVTALLAAGAQLERFAGTWGPPLIKACWRGHPSACSALVAHGADVNVQSECGTPLIQAINNKRAEVVAILLSAGADPHLRCAWQETDGNREYVGKTPLEFARVRKLKKIVPLLENPPSREPHSRT